MTARVDANRLAPEGRQATAVPRAYVNRSWLESALLELVKIRASRINGRAFCLPMHVPDAHARGEREARVL